MGTRRVVRFAVVVAAVAAALTVGAGAGAAVAAQEVGYFTVSGEVDGLYPGATTTLPVQVTNPQPFAIRVISAATTADDANAACPGSMLGIGPVHSPIEIAAGATGTVPLEVHLDPAAPDACQGATFLLDFVVTADEAGAGSAASGGPSGLAFTGATIGALTAVGLALIAGGVFARRFARSRRAVAS